MAEWIKLPAGNYLRLSQMMEAHVDRELPLTGGTWAIYGATGNGFGTFLLRGGYFSAAAAQAALDAAIANNGGSV